MAEPGTPKVLFVDDTPMEADLYEEYFIRDPTIVPITALSADEALSRLGNTDIDCLVSDSVHTSDGEPLVTVAKQAYPELPVVLYSSRSPEELPTETVDAALRKGSNSDSLTPLETLGETIRELTDHESRSTASVRTAPTRKWNVIDTFDWDEQSYLPMTIIEALADHTGQELTEMEPLFATIDPDALDSLLTHAATRGADTSVVVEFQTSGYIFRIDSDGTVAYKTADH